MPTRGELVEVTRVLFGAYARDWVAHYQGRTSRGFRDSTRAAYRQMLDDRVIPEPEPRAVGACARATATGGPAQWPIR